MLQFLAARKTPLSFIIVATILSDSNGNSFPSNRKRKKREHNADRSNNNQDTEAGDNGGADNSQPLLNDSGEFVVNRNPHYMTTPEIVVNPPSARESPELKHQNVKV